MNGKSDFKIHKNEVNNNTIWKDAICISDIAKAPLH